MSLQSNAERIIVRNLLASVGAARATAALQGSGVSGQPAGVIGAAGVATASGATLSQTKLANCLYDVEFGNGGSDGAFILHPADAKICRLREAASGSGFLMDSEGRICSRPAYVTTACPSGTIVYGDWPSLFVGQWGEGLAVAVDPHANFPRHHGHSLLPDHGRRGVASGFLLYPDLGKLTMPAKLLAIRNVYCNGLVIPAGDEFECSDANAASSSPATRLCQPMLPRRPA